MEQAERAASLVRKRVKQSLCRNLGNLVCIGDAKVFVPYTVGGESDG